MKKLLLVLFILVVVVGVWWWESPVLALKGLQDAAQDRDVAELEERIDLPAFRQSLKDELGEIMDRQAAANQLGPLGTMAGRAVVGQAVDELVTPEGLAAAMAAPPRDPVLRALAGSLGAVAQAQAKRTDWEIERGLSTFRVRRVSGDGVPLPDLLFERDGLGWDLVGIDIPDTLPAPTA